MPTIIKNTTDLQTILDKVNELPKATAGNEVLDALIDGSVTEITSNATTLRNNALSSCVNLKTIYFSSLQSIPGMPLSDCKSLTAMVLRSEVICSLGIMPGMSFSGCYHYHGTKDATYNPDGLKDGYIYVPRALLSDDDATRDYRRATNWTTFSTQFRAIEDYSIDGTITGKLDWEKVNA